MVAVIGIRSRLCFSLTANQHHFNLYAKDERNWLDESLEVKVDDAVVITNDDWFQFYNAKFLRFL